MCKVQATGAAHQLQGFQLTLGCSAATRACMRATPLVVMPTTRAHRKVCSSHETTVDKRAATAEDLEMT
jgi:hypothetical protein